MTATHSEPSHGVPLRSVPRVPAAPRAVITRHRVIRRLNEAFESAGIVELLAAGGWGKTTAAWQYAAAQERVVVWHTVGEEAAGELHQLFREHLPRDLPGTGREYLLVLDEAQRML